MSRNILGSTIGSDPSFVKSIEEGGTSASTYIQASQQLNYPLKETIGFAQGPAPLDPNGYVPSNMIPSVILTRTGVQISGPLTIGIGLQGTYTIANYDSSKTYTVSAISGSASISGNTITYTAPLQTGSSGIVVNGVTTFITVIDPADNPQVSGPSSLLENQVGSYTITNYDPNSVYNVSISQGSASQSNGTITVTAPPGDGIHNVNITLSVNSLQIVITVQAPPVAVITGPTSFPINTSQTFTISNYTPPCTYNVSVTGGTYTRSGATITYTAPSTVGNYSLNVNGTVYAFATTLPTINQPSIVSPVNASTNLGPTVNFTGSAFSISSGSDTQRASNWQLATDPGFTSVIQSSYNDSTNLTTWGVNNLAANTTFYVRVQYIGNSGSLSSYSNAVLFSTKVSYIASVVVSSFLTDSGFTTPEAISLNAQGNLLAVGNYHYNPTGTSNTLTVGIVRIYSRNGAGWTQISTINSPLGTGSSFGVVVKFNPQGNYLVVGASGENSNTGACYLYNSTDAGNTWSQVNRFAPPGSVSSTNNYFGSRCDLSDDGSVVSFSSPFGSQNNGCVVVISAANTQNYVVRTIIGSASYNYFGANHCINSTGSMICIAAPFQNQQADNNSGGDGFVYVYSFVNGSWQYYSSFSSSDNGGPSGGNFGNSLNFNSSNNIIAVGAPKENNQTGAVYFYNISGGFISKITGSQSGINFGNFLDVSDNLVLFVSDNRQNGNAQNTGFVNIYQSSNNGNSWNFIRSIAPPTNQISFGTSVVCDNAGSIAACFSQNTSGQIYLDTMS